jgi:hypothetical protein
LTESDDNNKISLLIYKLSGYFPVFKIKLFLIKSGLNIYYTIFKIDLFLSEKFNLKNNYYYQLLKKAGKQILLEIQKHINFISIKG